MKKLSISMLVLFAATLFAGSVYAEDAKVTGSASVGVFNRYIFRGYEIGTHSAVIQPSVSLSYKGFTGNVWGNIDTHEHETQSFVPERLAMGFNEIDLTLSYTYSIGKLSLTGGYIYYDTRYVDETEELFVSATYDIITKPTIAVYRDIKSYPGTYVNLSLSHSLPVYKDMTLDLGASAGYFSGDDNYFRTDDGDGVKYRALHDGMVKAGLTIPIAKNLSVQPVVQYWYPLSGKAKRHNYNPNGHLDDTFVTGLNLTFTF